MHLWITVVSDLEMHGPGITDKPQIDTLDLSQVIFRPTSGYDPAICNLIG